MSHTPLEFAARFLLAHGELRASGAACVAACVVLRDATAVGVRKPEDWARLARRKHSQHVKHLAVYNTVGQESHQAIQRLLASYAGLRSVSLYGPVDDAVLCMLQKATPAECAVRVFGEVSVQSFSRLQSDCPKVAVRNDRAVFTGMGAPEEASEVFVVDTQDTRTRSMGMLHRALRPRSGPVRRVFVDTCHRAPLIEITANSIMHKPAQMGWAAANAKVVVVRSPPKRLAWHERGVWMDGMGSFLQTLLSKPSVQIRMCLETTTMQPTEYHMSLIKELKRKGAVVQRFTTRA